MSNVSSLNMLFKQVYAGLDKNTLTVDDWLNYNITEDDAKKYNNAFQALEIQNSTLFQVLRETEENKKRPDVPQDIISAVIPSGVKLLNCIKFNKGDFHGAELNCPEKKKKEDR